MFDTTLATVDVVVIAIYFVVITAKGVRVAQQTHTDDDLFLAGRTLGFGVIGLSLFASNISSTTLIGLAGAAYTDGIAVANYEWMAGLVLVFMAISYIPLYVRTRLKTVPEFLERRFDRSCRLYFSSLTLVLTLFVDTAGGLYAGALALQVFFPGLAIWQTVAVLAVFCAAYTAAGGLRAVVHTDAIQAVVLVVGCSLMTWMLFADFDHSFSQLKASVTPRDLSLLRPIDDEQLPGLGTLVGVPVLGFWYWATNQYITQRILGARDVEQAQQGALLGGALKLLPLFIMVLPGLMARQRLPDLSTPDQVFPMLVVEVLPAGLVGLVIAGLFAAIMSSIDSTLNSASALVMYDFLQVDEQDVPPQRVLLWGRLATFGFMLLAALWAPQIQNFSGLFAYLQQAFSVVVPPVAAIFLLGAFSRRGAGLTALVTLLFGHGLGLILFLAHQQGWWRWHFTITVGLVTAVSAAFYWVVAEFTPPPTPDALTYTLSTEHRVPLSSSLWRACMAITGLTLLMLLVLR